MKKIVNSLMGVFVLLISGLAIAGPFTVSNTTENYNSVLYSWSVTLPPDLDLVLAPGESYQAEEKVTVAHAGSLARAGVRGTISVENTSGADNVLWNISAEDAFLNPIDIGLTCPSTLPTPISAGQTITCSYDKELPDGEQYQIVVNVQSDGGFSGGTTSIYGDTRLPVTAIDKCVVVSDPLDPIATERDVCYPEALNTNIYISDIGPYSEPDQCGEQSAPHTVDLLRKDEPSVVLSSATRQRDATVMCDDGGDITGCTLSKGYWKTHCKYGPAPYDDACALLSDDVDTLFPHTKVSYYDVLKTSPRGNVFYIMGSQLAAFDMNVLNGASVPDSVALCRDEARGYFANYTERQMRRLKRTDPATRDRILEVKDCLVQSNAGRTDGGPPHCDEDYTSGL